MTRTSSAADDELDLTSEGGPVTDADIALAADAVRRFLSGRVPDPARAQDLAQEAVVRLIEVRDRLDGAAAAPYAVTIAKHLLIAQARRADVERRHAHRMVDRRAPSSPEDEALRQAEVAAVAAALEGLAADDRRALVAHVIEGRATASLAEESGGTAGGVAARLARTRAQMRVDYVLAARGITLPSERCRPVLHAISAGDQRRQHRLRTARHLLDCPTCADVSPPLLERQRSLVALVPIPGLAAAIGHLRHAARPRQVAAAAAIALVLAGAGAAVAARDDGTSDDRAATTASTVTTQSRDPSATASTAEPDPPSDPSAPESVPGTDAPDAPGATDSGRSAAALEVDGRSAIDVLRDGGILDHLGRPVVARSARVESVPADEGFWVGTGPGARLWVQFDGDGESAVQVTSGAEISFTGVLVGHDAGFGELVGLTDPEAGGLDDAGAHVEVDPDAVTIG